MMKLEEKALLVVEAMEEKKAEDIVVMDLRGLCSVVDVFVICSAQTGVQAQAIADEIEKVFSMQGVSIWRREGYTEANWILLDYGDIVIHIFQSHARKVYDLDGLWGDAPRLCITMKEEK